MLELFTQSDSYFYRRSTDIFSVSDMYQIHKRFKSAPNTNIYIRCPVPMF